MTDSRKTVWLLGICSVAAVMFSLFALVWLQLTMSVLALIFGAYTLVGSAVPMETAWPGRHERRRALACAGAGVLGVAVGSVTGLQPVLTALALVLMAGAWALGRGERSCGSPEDAA